MKTRQDFSSLKVLMNLNQTKIALSAKEVSKHYRSVTKKVTVALDNVHFSICKGEKVAIIGESGSGKTTLAKILCGLIAPTSGEIRFEGKLIDKLSEIERRNFRMKVQYIPQYPDLALDPTWYIYDSIAEPLRIHKLTYSKQDEFEKVGEVCERVGISMDQLKRKPRSLSGGELQRAVIGRAIILKPEIIIADEPTSMLDPSMQAKIIRTLLNLQLKFNIGMTFITHDVELAKIVSEKMFVMLGGSIVESGPTHEVIKNPLHPYTKSLFKGSSPKNEFVLSFPCKFYSECDMRLEVCCQYSPSETEVYNGRRVRCWKYVNPKHY